MDAEEHFATLAAVWDEHAEAMDAAMGEHGWAARAALAAAPGERVIDVGCGAGLATVALGAEVGPDGWVAAVDVAAEMVAAAARRMSAAGVHGVAVTADAGTADLAEVAGAGVPFDAVHARFGLMFFDDPESALRNIFRALRPGGRLAASVWQQLLDNLWMVLTTATALPILGAQRPPLPEPGQPGPFSMADPDATTALLTGAGFVDVKIRPVDAPFLFEGDGHAAAERVLSAGPLGPAFLAADATTRREAVAGVVAALDQYRSPTGYLVPAASWCVTARRP
ncbi:hypothetical protein BOH72_08785 [Mycobacterium sp. WY10]|nr:hypothetical protein BOH72_08785 [Mycobacterium sp. WY10]